MFSPGSYLIISELFPRLLGAIYFFALTPFIFQIKGLIGENGIQPVSNLLQYFERIYGKKRFWRIPTLFWVSCSDAALMSAVIIGVICSLLLILGLSPVILLPILIVIHLSIITVGQDFLSFGWEGFFIEVSCNAFLLSLTPTPNLWVLISLNLLIFRFHVQAGASKLQSGDPNWKNLTALAYHYETQPIPNMVAWYFHKLPLGFHKFSTGAMFFIELVVPFGVLGNEPIRLATFILLFSLQFFIWISGNYSYLNYLTAVLCTLLISDTYLSPIFGTPEIHAPTPLYLDALVSIPAFFLISLQLMQLWNHFFPNAALKRLFKDLFPYHIVNRYGIFAVMTTMRYEIVIEGSDEGHEWKEYLFSFKPSEVDRRPRRISPFQPRIDWQAWFLPFDAFENASWFKHFIARLFQGEPSVLKLLRHNPFPDHPPRYLRAQIYFYQLSTWKIKKDLGHWWVRTYVGPYSPILERKH